jgi:superfamily II DNA/RNA helicase
MKKYIFFGRPAFKNCIWDWKPTCFYKFNLEHFTNSLIKTKSKAIYNKNNQGSVEKYSSSENFEYGSTNYDPSESMLESIRKNNPIINKYMKKEEYSLSFKEFKFLPEIYNVLDNLNFMAPTSIQSVAIPKIMEKKHVFLTSSTGSGKTLSYVLPLIHELKLQEKTLNKRLTAPQRPRAIILVPSRELAQQVEEVIKLFVYDLPLVVESFYVGKKYQTEKKYSKSGLDILVTTPERFKNHWSKNNIFISRVTHVVIDELDTLLDAGYEEFIEYMSEEMLKRNYEDEIKGEVNNLRQLIYASTTITNNIDDYMSKIFASRTDFVKIIDKTTNHNLSNIKHEFMHVTDFNKYPTLVKVLNDNEKILKENMSIIIFCNSVSCVRKTELVLRENNLPTACLHGDIPPIRRKLELEKFKRRTAKILICTDLIARGLDFPFVFLVINFDFPKTVSDYLHRAGRTGRNGRKGIVLSFYRNFNNFLIEKIKKAHKLNIPMEIQNSMYSIRKALPDVENLYRKPGPKKRITLGIRERKILKYNEEYQLTKLRERQEKLKKFSKFTKEDRDKIIRKIDLTNKRREKKKRGVIRTKLKLRKTIYN